MLCLVDLHHVAPETACENLDDMVNFANPASGAACLHQTAAQASQSFLYFFFWVEESLHVHRCQSYQQPERQIKQATGEYRVHSASYDKGSCFAMA